jgi:hypothetical protein
MRNILLLFLGSCLFYACNEIGLVGDKKQSITQDSSKSKHPKGELFKDDTISTDAQREKIFKPILSSETRKNGNLLLKKFKDFYPIKLEKGLELKKCYSVKMYGCKDSVWVMEAIHPNDSSCLPHGLKQQLFFDAKGHLIHTDKASNIGWTVIKENQGPLLITLNTDCNGKGYHHVYKFENGELIDIFNVLLENTPATFDSNQEGDDVNFQPNELELKIEDRNKDKRNDLVFKGTRQTYKDKKFLNASPIEYVFLYQPGEDWFVLKSSSK